MRRMISFAPVAHGTINVADNRFVLDNKLEEGFYLITIDESTYGQSCSCFLKITSSQYNNSTPFVSYEDSDRPSVILSHYSGEPNYLNLGTPDSMPAGSTVEVIRIA